VPSGTRIPIEKFGGPILLIQGENDTAWHGRGQTHDIEESLKRFGKSPVTYYSPAPDMTLRELQTWAVKCGSFKHICNILISPREGIDVGFGTKRTNRIGHYLRHVSES
jgi:hypothetical protein